MNILRYTGGMVATNGYLVECEGGNFLIDAPAGISDWLKEKNKKITDLVLTHQHYDHVEDVEKLQSEGVRVSAWSDYSQDLTLETFGKSWGLPEVKPFQIDSKLTVGEGILCGEKVHIGHVPGHSPDSISLYFPNDELCFVGDALFAGSVGRCDLPGGSLEVLISGIRRELLSLPDETTIYPGHGGTSLIGKERVSNGYLLQNI